MITSLGTISNLRVTGNILRDGVHLVPSAVNAATFAALNATPIGNATPSSGSFTAINGTRLSIQGDSDLNSVSGSTITALVLRANIALIPTANVSTNLGDSALWWRQAWIRDLAVQNVDVSQSLVPATTNTINLGSPTRRFNRIYGLSSESQYADLAEIYAADAEYTPGTVVIFGGSAEITMSVQSHNPAVAGVISTAPGYLLNSGATGLPLALSGRVPCQVTGPVKRGDRLVSGTNGAACVLDEQKYTPGCVIGHSLADVPAGETRLVEVVIMKY